MNKLAALFVLLLGVSWGVLPGLTPGGAAAQTSTAPAPSLEPLDMQLLQQESLPIGGNIVTAKTISQWGTTIPSLWWAKEQFDEDKEFGGKFIVNWIAYQDQKRVDLLVNRQLWTILDYLGRYRFINKFGTLVSDDYYNVRVFNEPETPVATYTCDYAIASGDRQPSCEIRVNDAFSRGGLQIPRQ